MYSRLCKFLVRLYASYWAVRIIKIVRDQVLFGKRPSRTYKYRPPVYRR